MYYILGEIRLIDFIRCIAPIFIVCFMYIKVKKLNMRASVCFVYDL